MIHTYSVEETHTGLISNVVLAAITKLRNETFLSREAAWQEIFDFQKNINSYDVVDELSWYSDYRNNDFAHWPEHNFNNGFGFRIVEQVN